MSGMLQAFWLTDLNMSQQVLAQGVPLPHIFIEAFWTFFIMVDSFRATIRLVFYYLCSRPTYLYFIGRLSVMPDLLSISEPVVLGTPVVVNPVFFILLLPALMVNAVLAWTAMKPDLISRVISVVPWTAPAPVDGAWALDWDFQVAVLVIVLTYVLATIYFPPSKVYGK